MRTGARSSAGVVHTVALSVLLSKVLLAAHRCRYLRCESLGSHESAAPGAEVAVGGDAPSPAGGCVLFGVLTVWPTENWKKPS